MEKGKSKENLPSTSDGIKSQEEVDRLLEEESTMRKEVDIFLQEELDKLLAEKETIRETEQLPRKPSQESRTSEKLRAQHKKSRAGMEQPGRLQKVDEDLMTFLDESWDVPKEPSREDLEDPWDKLSLFDESMLELRKERGRPSSQEEVGETSAEEKKTAAEEKEEGGQPLEEKEEVGGRRLEEKESHLIKMSAKGGQHLMKPIFMDYREEEDNLKAVSKHSLWSMRSSMGAIFEQKLQNLQNLRGSIQKKSISKLPFGYFSKFSKPLTSREATEKGEQPSEEPEPRHWIPRFLRRSKPKRIASLRSKSLKSQLERDQVTKLSKIFSEDFFKGQDRRPSEDVPDEDFPQSPDDIPQQSEEEWKQTQEEESKKQEEVPSTSLGPPGQRARPGQMGASRDFPDFLFKDKAYKQKFLKHERDSKVAVPLPLQELMEEEVLAILKATLAAYQRRLGGRHPLTEQMEEQVEKLHLQLQGRGII